MKAVILSSQASSYLADTIALQLGGAIGRRQIERMSFADGERYYRIGMELRGDLMGENVIYVASTHTDEDLLELYRVGCALSEYGTRRRIFVIPYFGYSTMERAVLPGEVVTAKKNARLLSSIPNVGMGNTFLLLDLHTAGLVHYFEGDCLRYELYSERIISEALEELQLKNFVFASADLGRPRAVQAFAEKFGTDIALVSKSRKFEETKVYAVIGDVKGKAVVIYDDMTRSGGSLLKAAEAYLEHGATEVYAAISHLALTDPRVVSDLEKSVLKKIITTNSHPMSVLPEVGKAKKIVVKDVAPLFSEVIERIVG